MEGDLDKGPSGSGANIGNPGAVSAESLFASLQSLIQSETSDASSGRQRTDAVMEKAPTFFVKDKMSFKMWKTEVLRWQKYRMWRNNKTQQADQLLYEIPWNHTVKVKLEDEMVQHVNKENGVEHLISLLDEIYGEDEMSEVFIVFKDLFQKKRLVGQDIMEYTVEWETIYKRAVNKGLGLPETDKAFLYLSSCSVDESKLSHILAEVKISTEQEKNSVHTNIKTAVKK